MPVRFGSGIANVRFRAILAKLTFVQTKVLHSERRMLIAQVLHVLPDTHLYVTLTKYCSPIHDEFIMFQGTETDCRTFIRKKR